VARELINNETAIREIFDSWAAAVRAEDINGIRANHSPDMLMFDVPPPLFSRGLDAYMDTWNLFYKCQVRPVVLVRATSSGTYHGEQEIFLGVMGPPHKGCERLCDLPNSVTV
jgi:hypothetical protein